MQIADIFHAIIAISLCDLTKKHIITAHSKHKHDEVNMNQATIYNIPTNVYDNYIQYKTIQNMYVIHQGEQLTI